MDEEKKRGFFGGLGRVITAPPRFIWDKLTVDDEERERNRQRKEARRAERDARDIEEQNRRALEGYGAGSGLSGEDARSDAERVYGDASKRFRLMKIADKYGVSLEEAALMEEAQQRNRENTLYTLQVLDQKKAIEDQKKMQDLELLMQAMAEQSQYTDAYMQNRPQGGQSPLPSVRAPSYAPRRF